MHPRQTWMAIGLLTAFTVQAAVIYKWVDADGVVHYSDQSSPGAEKITTASSSAPAAAATARNATGPIAPQQRAALGGLNYSEFSITSPAPEQTFFGDDVVAVHLDLNPALRPNQSITWHLNGKQLDFPPNAVVSRCRGWIAARMRWPPPSPISKRAIRRPATALPSSCVSPRRSRRSRRCASSLELASAGCPACRLSSK